MIRRVREWSDVPIIVLSAREREAEKIDSLDLGADDYVNKPFNVGELMARMRTALRHRLQRKAETPVLRVGGLEVDSVRHRVMRGGAELKLTPKEFELLSLLASKPGKVFLRNEILNQIWGTEVIVGDRTIDVHIRKIRQKLGLDCITTVKGVGYKFEL